MNKLKYASFGLATATIVGFSAIGVASAATNNSNGGNVGTSGIPRSVFRQDRLDAAAEVLNTTTSNIQTAHKDKTFASLINNAGLTRKTYRQKLKAQLTSELEAQGYTQDQITIAFQHRVIHHLRHHKK